MRERLKLNSAADILFFGSHLAHRSGPNKTPKPRAMVYATYAATAEGNLRDKYYEHRRATFPPDHGTSLANLLIF